MSQPDYYKSDGLSPMDAFKDGLIIREEYIGFIKGNVIKYVVRAGKKDNAVEDLLKAKDYIDFYLDLFEDTDDDSNTIVGKLLSKADVSVSRV